MINDDNKTNPGRWATRPRISEYGLEASSMMLVSVAVPNRRRTPRLVALAKANEMCSQDSVL